MPVDWRAPIACGSMICGITLHAWRLAADRDLGMQTEPMTVSVKDRSVRDLNRHDVDFPHLHGGRDCVFGQVRDRRPSADACGPRAGTRWFRRRVPPFPDVHFGDARHFVSGDRGLSEWLFTATTSDGKKIEVTGCDVFTFKGDKIAVKNSYLKNRTA